MTEPTITCPNCKTDIKLTESLAAPLIESIQHECQQRLAQKDADVANRETSLQEREAALFKAREQIEDRVAEKLRQERAKIVFEEGKKAKLSAAADLDQKTREVADLQEVLKQREGKLAEAQNAQAALIRKQRDLDDAKRELNLTVEKRVQERLVVTRDRARRDVEEQMKFKVMEKEQTITSMQKQIEDLKRRAEQGSQQLQGEVQELDLETLLRGKFPLDTIERVPKGECGGDLLHRVAGLLGKPCGTILWEAKRTRNWSDGWLAKLREDQRASKAEVAVVVSQTLPKSVETFDQIDGVWVVHPRLALPLASALRLSLADIASARQASEGQQTKMEMVYQYLTGSRFRQRVEAIVEAFSSMQEDLDMEKRATTRQWAKREEQIDRVMQSTSGMYGDLQGIAGKTLKEIDGLSLRVLNAPDNTARSFE